MQLRLGRGLEAGSRGLRLCFDAGEGLVGLGRVGGWGRVWGGVGGGVGVGYGQPDKRRCRNTSYRGSTVSTCVSLFWVRRAQSAVAFVLRCLFS